MRASRRTNAGPHRRQRDTVHRGFASPAGHQRCRILDPRVLARQASTHLQAAPARGSHLSARSHCDPADERGDDAALMPEHKPEDRAARATDQSAWDGDRRIGSSCLRSGRPEPKVEKSWATAGVRRDAVCRRLRSRSSSTARTRDPRSRGGRRQPQGAANGAARPAPSSGTIQRARKRPASSQRA